MADDAIAHVERLNTLDPKKPFFVYYAPGATHSPHHPTPEWIDKFKGKLAWAGTASGRRSSPDRRRWGSPRATRS